jgi:hypothetical protein
VGLTISLSAGAITVIAICVGLFLAATACCAKADLFGSKAGMASAFDGAFILLIYALVWAVPSLIAWAVWATWLR